MELLSFLQFLPSKAWHFQAESSQVQSFKRGCVWVDLCGGCKDEKESNCDAGLEVQMEVVLKVQN